MQRLSELPPSVQNYLRDFVSRWKRLVALRAAGSALLVLALWILAAGTADRLLHLPASIRLSSLILAALAALAVGLYRLGRLRGEVDWVAMAGVIEQHDPRFGQALVTVTSRMLGSPEHRGSDEILSHLLREVELHAADEGRHRLFTFRSAAGPWAVLLIVVVAIIWLARVPELGGARLLARMIDPLAGIPPVTTTDLTVMPGDGDVMQAEAFHIDVSAQRLGSSPVVIFLSDENGSWSQYPMDDAGNGRYTYTINTVGRDLYYKIAGGDAVRGPFTIRVKRPPAIAEYKIRYTYPPYTRHPPTTATNTDGTIEAPAGTEAMLTITATEPIQSALLTVGTQKILMSRATPDTPQVRQATLRVQNDINYEIDLISTREVRGGPGRLTIRATPDHPPLARLFQAGQTLRLNPRDILPLTYQAIDDFGLSAISIVAQVNANKPVRMPLKVAGDHRRQEETINFDLGSLNFKVGDVLSLTIAARDTAGQETTADELRVLISPRSIDLDAHERIDELSAAAGYGLTMAGEFEAAGKAAEEADGQKDRQSSSYLAAASRASRHLTGASEAATLLRQALLRTAAHSDSSELAVALGVWIDSAHQESEIADEMFRKGGSTEGMGGPVRDQIRRAFDSARDLNSQVKAVAEGERAAALLLDKGDLKAAQAAHVPADPEAAQRLAKTLSRVNDEIAASAAQIGVNAGAADLDNQLRSRVESAKNIVRSKQPLDFAAISRDWSQALQRDPHQPTNFDTRLATAAQAEAVRKDADLQCARDEELAGRAAGAIESALRQTPAGKPVSAGQLNAYATAMAALYRVHRMSREPANAHSADEVRLASQVAGKAREEMARWAGELKEAKNANAPSRSTELESLALRAGAAAARRDYKRVAEDDRLLVQRLSDAARKPGGRSMNPDLSTAASQLAEERISHIEHTAEKVARQMSKAEAVDKLDQTQEKLAAEARSTKNASRDLAVRQRGVADQIAKVEGQEETSGFPANGAVIREMDDPNWRGRATAALLFAQEELAAMPQDLAGVQEADQRRRKTAERAAAARQEASNATPERRVMVSRAADQAEQDARDAAAQLEKAIAPVAPEVSADLADRLDPFAPEASAAREVVTGPLASSFKALAAACRNGDADAVGRSAGDALKAIDAAQKELTVAQDEFTARDPLIAAKWFARAAADSMSRHPDDLRAALSHQNNVSLALSHAWNHSIHKAAELRLAELPSMATIYSPQQSSPHETATATALSPNSGSHDWAHLHAREGDDLTATMHDPDPPGYEEPLRLYFEALGKAQEKPRQ